MIPSRPYRQQQHPGHAAWQARVLAHFEARVAREAARGGETSAAGHTRQGPNGPIQVHRHTRTVTCD